jgi:hypothetical protein
VRSARPAIRSASRVAPALPVCPSVPYVSGTRVEPRARQGLPGSGSRYTVPRTLRSGSGRALLGAPPRAARTGLRGGPSGAGNAYVAWVESVGVPQEGLQLIQYDAKIQSTPNSFGSTSES